MKKDDHLFLVDGSAYIFRAFHALPPLTRKSDGLPVGAVAGFCNMLWKLLQDARDTDVGVTPTHFAVIFDYSSKTFRKELYPEYKANRSEPPEDLVPQFGLIREATKAFNLPCIEVEGLRGRRYHRDLCAAGRGRRRAGDDHLVGQGPDAARHRSRVDVRFDEGQADRHSASRREIRRQTGKDDRPAGADRRFDRQHPGRARHRPENGGAAARRIWRSRHAAGARRRNQAEQAAREPDRIRRPGAVCRANW